MNEYLNKINDFDSSSSSDDEEIIRLLEGKGLKGEKD